MSFKATTLFLLTICALLAPVKSAPTFHSLNVRQYDSQNMTSNSTNSPSTTPTNTSTSDFLQQDGLAAQKMNAEFATIKATDPCQAGQMACVNSSFAQCVAGQWELSPCSSADLNCYALPRGDKPGLSLVCDTQANALQRFVSAGVQGGVTGNDTTDSTDPDDCDDDDVGDDDSGDDCDDPTDSTLPVAATPSPTGVPAIPSQANNTSVAAVTGSTTPAMSLTTSTLYRRQILTPSSLSASAPTTSPDATPTPSSNISSSLPIITSSAPTTATSSSSSTNGIVSPTVVIGTNGIVTVTVVSTVTVSATDCAAAGASTDAASTLVPSFGTAFTLLTPTGSPLTPTSLSASTSLSAPTSTPSSLTSSSATLPPSPVATSTPITTSTTASFGFGFTFSTPAATTPTPAPTNTPTSSLNISELLTATA